MLISQAGYGELNREILEQSIEAIEQLCTSKNLTLSSPKKAKIIARKPRSQQ
ncbi:hypothetical protein P4S72_07395 [Vibrio sp. PP-XX7]